MPLRQNRNDVLVLAGALALLSAITAACSAGFGVTSPTIAALAYLLVVLSAAAVSTLWVAVAVSVAAVLLLNYFFMAPVGTLAIADPQNWVALVVMLAVSVIGSHLSASARARARDASTRRDELSRLFELSRDILITTDTADAHARLARSVADRFDLSYVAVCLPAAQGWQVHEAGAGQATLPRDQLEAVWQVAEETFDRNVQDRDAGGRRSIYSQHGSPVHVIPLRLAGRPVGLLAIAGRTIEETTFETLAGVVAIAVERTQFLSEREAAELARLAAELKSTLVDSLAHDLKTPLTAIRVAASNLEAGWATDAERRAQTDIVLAEVERLTRLFESLLQMARIETNAVVAAREWVTPAEIVDVAINQARRHLADHRLVTEVPDEVAACVDPRLTSAALAHLLENAAQYSPGGSTIRIRAAAGHGGVTLHVEDEGPGLADADLPHLFERFYRGSAARNRPAGAGMGLAVARGLLAAEQGTLSGANRPEGGARFSMTVPAEIRSVASSSAGEL